MNGDSMGGWGDEARPPRPARGPACQSRRRSPPGPKRSAPPVRPSATLEFPAIERTTLSNGIPVALARRTGDPQSWSSSIDFDAGYAADALDTPGTQGLMLEMLEEGTTTRSATQIAEEQERLGASIDTGASLDTSSVTLSALTANLAPSLALTADVLLHPAFAPADVDARQRPVRSAALRRRCPRPMRWPMRTLGAELFGKHPYAQPGDGLGLCRIAGSADPAGPARRT